MSPSASREELEAKSKAAWKRAETAARWYGRLDTSVGNGAILVRVEPCWLWKMLGLGEWAKRRGVKVVLEEIHRGRRMWKVK